MHPRLGRSIFLPDGHDAGAEHEVFVVLQECDVVLRKKILLYAKFTTALVILTVFLQNFGEMLRKTFPKKIFWLYLVVLLRHVPRVDDYLRRNGEHLRVPPDGGHVGDPGNDPHLLSGVEVYHGVPLGVAPARVLDAEAVPGGEHPAAVQHRAAAHANVAAVAEGSDLADIVRRKSLKRYFSF